MLFNKNLLSFHIIERESGKNFLIWTYPTISDDLKDFLVQKQVNNFTCCKRNSTWIYFKPFNHFTIVLLTQDYSPVKYKTLLEVFEKTFIKSKNPVDLVKLYLKLFSDGICSIQENGTAFTCNLKALEHYGLADFIKLFDLEVVLIYTTILLKRRMVVYSKNGETLQKNLLAVSKLVPKRNQNEYLLPLVTSTKELKGLSFFVAGVMEKKLTEDMSLYDLLVNLDTLELFVTPQAKETLTMTKTHKELATFLVKLANETGMEESQIIKKIEEKNDNLIEQLKSMASITTANGFKMITLADLKEKNYSQNLENFLFNLAEAEHMMML